MTIATVIVFALNVNTRINFLETKAIIVSAYSDADGIHPVYQFINARTGMQATVMGFGREWQNFRIGEEVSILYDPNNPSGPNSIMENSLLNVWALPTIMVLCSLVTWFLVYMGMRPLKPPTEHHARHSRSSNLAIIGVTILFVVSMLVFVFSIGVDIWTAPLLAILCLFVILALHASTKPREVLPDV